VNVVTRAKIKDVKIEFWKDDAKQDALCSYAFQGWISRLETSNPAPAVHGWDYVSKQKVEGALGTINHLLTLDIEPALNQANFSEIRMSN